MTGWNCLFCCSVQGEPLSLEHLVSQPVADAFGIDRSNSIASIDAETIDRGQPEIRRMVRMSELAVRLPCRACNSTWMNDLEHGMAAVARWTRARENALTVEADRTLRRWLLKTYIVVAAIAGGSRRFGTTDDFYLLPEATRARLLWENSDEAFDRVGFGFARWGTAGSFMYCVGNPTVVPSGDGYASCRSAGALTLNLGTLSTCVVVTHLANEVTIPAPYRALEPGDRYRDLRRTSRLLQTDEIVVDNGEHDIRQMNADLIAWAQRQDAAAKDDAGD